uniref:Nucleotidyltransferase domain-containing protein n=1 Tax=Candidatus Kentrum sp. LFY TaxID=2126342 RepID=A0A450WQZ4_9GAMM|nr:MAG: Nucleotidyltransferase domain-containing protein [Candidatus Kentron sp. LFY]
MGYSEILKGTDSFRKRNEDALRKIDKIREEFEKNIDITRYGNISVFCAGSLGRGDIGEYSDLDIFILSEEKGCNVKRIDTLELLATAIDINKRLEYPEFSNDGKYLHVYSFPDMLDALGAPDDDVRNLFTARMLLLLESRPVFNDELYKKYIDRTVKKYFRDSVGKKSFRLLFLINDILRYWRTVCLNYELVRNDQSKPWRKKNINLKFSRMLTVFGTIMPLIATPSPNREAIEALTKKTPMERLAIGLDYLGDNSMEEKFKEFLDVYEEFLKLKEKMKSKPALDKSDDSRVKEMPEIFSWFLYDCLTHRKIKKYRKYLIL